MAQELNHTDELLNRSFGEVTTDESDVEEQILTKVQAPLANADVSSLEDNLWISECGVPLTTNLAGREIQAVVGPAFYQKNSIIWLIKFSDRSTLELVSANLMNKYFAPYVIRYYERRIVPLNDDDIEIDLSLENAAWHMFDDPVEASPE